MSSWKDKEESSEEDLSYTGMDMDVWWLIRPSNASFTSLGPRNLLHLMAYTLGGDFMAVVSR